MNTDTNNLNEKCDMSLEKSCGEEPLFSVKEIMDHCKTYKGADTSRSLYQLITTLALFVGTCCAMYYIMPISYWLMILLAVPAAGFLVRLFIFQHDCGHGSFFKSRKANDWTGRCLSLLTFTPYDFWRRAHNKHHATSGNLDHRSIGGIDTITLREYQALSKGMKRAYRIYRNPIVLLIFGTPIYTILGQRIPFNQGTSFYENYQSLTIRAIWKSIMLTNLALIAAFGTLSLLLGLSSVIALYLPILVITSWIGGWLFYIQHQFEDAYWERHENWSVLEAALMGSSYYALPRILQWFAGNIGLHHIHHLCSKIPNYKLQECMAAKPVLQNINRMTLRESLKCVHLKLWDEDNKMMVPVPDSH